MNDEPPYELIVDGLLDGTVVPFFGSAASAAYRPENAPRWDIGSPFLPSGAELATILERASRYSAGKAEYEAALSDLADAVGRVAPGVSMEDIRSALDPALTKYVGGPPGLAEIASWLEVQNSRSILERKLRQAFEIKSTPGALHTRLAAFDRVPLYVTTNYDDLIEQALDWRGPHVLVDRGRRGLAIRTIDGTLEPIDRLGEALRRKLTKSTTGELSAPIVFKMHGSIDRKDRQNDSYLITEGDYVDYLGRDQGDYIPPYINSLMRGKNFLFLGYSLEDWNVRVILSKLLDPKKLFGANKSSESDGRADQERPESVCCWAIVRGRTNAEQRVWQSQSLNIYPMDVLVFTKQLEAEIERRA
jgi:SIR2-like domain